MLSLLRVLPSKRTRLVKRRKLVRCAMIESLESRAMLTTFSVINVNDTGAGSFRDAINLANATTGADTIAFAIPEQGSRRLHR